ncbi:LysR family transcriptional regulator [Pelagibius marinus]|uniref:LysR family transcriptional regulator n=1 Tax=Pelagibius marinus TaxID=2762760 RepID=UPI00187314C7|nr:LysR family transcriptional regulator [Pelagibius marinus]
MSAALNWADLRVVLALARGGSLSAAAQNLGIDQTTVSRRLGAVEAALQGRLFLRERGRLTLTALGETARGEAERMEASALALEAAAGEAGEAVAGRVRITAVPILVNQLIVPRVPALLQRHPALAIDANADSRNLSLSRRETDVALRFARPESGSGLCRKIGALAFSIYAARGTDAAAQPWVTYEERFLHYPQARWVADHVSPEDLSRLRINDAEGLVQAVRSGLGRGVLPDFMAARDPALQRVSVTPVLHRDLWLLVHPDLRKLPRVAAVLEWLAALPGQLRAEAQRAS